jgi:hypothetical protein
MDIRIVAGISTAIIIFALIVVAIMLRKSWPYQRQAVKTLSTDIRKVDVLIRMVGFNLAVSVTVLWKLFS